MSHPCPRTCGRLTTAAIFISVGVVQIIAGAILLNSKYVYVLSGPDFWTACANLAVGCLLGVSASVWKHTQKKAKKYALRRTMLNALVLSSMVVNATTTALLLMSEGNALMSISIEGDASSSLASELMAYAFATSICSPIICIVTACVFLSVCFRNNRPCGADRSGSRENILKASTDTFNWVFIPDRLRKMPSPNDCSESRSSFSSSSSDDVSDTLTRSNSIPSVDRFTHVRRGTRDPSDLNVRNAKIPRPKLSGEVNPMLSDFQGDSHSSKQFRDLTRKQPCENYAVLNPSRCTPHKSKVIMHDSSPFESGKISPLKSNKMYFEMPERNNPSSANTRIGVGNASAGILAESEFDYDSGRENCESKNLPKSNAGRCVESRTNYQKSEKPEAISNLHTKNILINESARAGISDEHQASRSDSSVLAEMKNYATQTPCSGEKQNDETENGDHNEMLTHKMKSIVNKRSNHQEFEELKKSDHKRIRRQSKMCATNEELSFGKIPNDKSTNCFDVDILHTDHSTPSYLRRTSTTTSMNYRRTPLHHSTDSSFSNTATYNMDETINISNSKALNDSSNHSLTDSEINSSFDVSANNAMAGQVVPIRLNRTMTQEMSSKLIPVPIPVVPSEFVQRKFKSKRDKTMLREAKKSRLKKENTFSSFRHDLQPNKYSQYARSTPEIMWKSSIGDLHSIEEGMTVKRSLSSPAQTSGYVSSLDENTELHSIGQKSFDT